MEAFLARVHQAYGDTVTVRVSDETPRPDLHVGQTVRIAGPGGGDDLQSLVESGCQDCMGVERTHDPMVGWVWIISDCSLDGPLQRQGWDDLLEAWRRHKAGEQVDARDDGPPVRLLDVVDRHPLWRQQLQQAIANLLVDYVGDDPDGLAEDREECAEDAESIMELLGEWEVIPTKETSK